MASIGNQHNPEHSTTMELNQVVAFLDTPATMASSISKSISKQTVSHLDSVYSTTNSNDDSISRVESFHTAIDTSPTASPTSIYSCNESNNDPTMLHFEVFWCDLSYQIQPKFSASNVFQKLKTNVSSVFRKHDEEKSSYMDTNDQIQKTIFKGLNGSFKSGQLTAVMGPSGAGKTSLLNCLSRRISAGYSGYIGVTNSKQRKLTISTIPQKDYLLEYLTVRENLMFASKLKNIQNNFDHDMNIERVASLLGIYDCLNTKTKKISGGQYKRVSIAQELLSKPDILILDEPTSGLDSLTCYRTMCVLRDLVQMSSKRLIDPIAIIVTIHQPQREVFDLFDKIYMMSTGGYAIYDGTPQESVAFIEAKSDLKIPDIHYNPASFMVEIASGEYGQEPIMKLEKFNRRIFEKHRNFLLNDIKEEEDVEFYSVPDDSTTSTNYRQIDDKSRANRLEDITTKFTKDKLSNYFNIRKRSDQDRSPSWSQQDSNVSSPVKTATDNLYKTSSKLQVSERLLNGASMSKGNFWTKTWLLTHRTWISIIRDPMQLIARILFHILCPLSMALMFGSEPGRANACPRHYSEIHINDLLDNKDIDGVSELQEQLVLTLENGALQFCLLYAMTSAAIGLTSLTFTLSMQSSLKEFHNGWYSMSSYFLGKTFADLPLEITMPILSICIAYPLTDQPTSPYQWRLLVMALALVLGSLIGQTIGLIFATIFIGNVHTAMFVAQGACLPFVFLSGFCVRTKRMSKFLYLLSYASFYRLTIEISMLARYGFGLCSCDPKSFENGDTKLVGVPQQLRAYTQYWFESMASPDEDIEDESDNSTSINLVTSRSIVDNSIAEVMVSINGSQNSLLKSIIQNGTHDVVTLQSALELVTNSTTIPIETTTLPSNANNEDIFEILAKQISLANSYGINMKSCDDMRPYQLYEMSLREGQLASRFWGLVVILVVLRVSLFFIVKLVIRYRSSL